MIRSASLHHFKYSFQSVERGLLPRLAKCYGFVTFSWLVGFTAFAGKLPGRARGEIFTVYGSYDVFSPKDAVL